MGWDEIIVFVGTWSYVEPIDDPEAPFDGFTGLVRGIHTDYLVYAANNLDFDYNVYADALARLAKGYIEGKAVDLLRNKGGYMELVAVMLYGYRYEPVKGRSVPDRTLVLNPDWFGDPVELVEELLFHSPLTRVEVDMTVEQGRVWPAHILISIPRDDEYTWLIANYEGVSGEGPLREALEKALAKHGVLEALKGPEEGGGCG